jgi:outer membrane protein OmpA-like peptidoglycan-associated protein
MKILIIGFFVFVSWSSLSTYVYVCKIKGLCYEAEPAFVPDIVKANVVDADTLSKSLVQNKALVPQNLLIYFDFDKSEYSSSTEGMMYYKESMAYMFQNPGAGLSITGYTDAIGSDEYNMALGYRRARSVQKYFEGKGMPSDKISVGSKGEKEPAESNTSPEGRAKNRRTVITIKP